MTDLSDENEIKALESARKVFNADIDRTIALAMARISALAEEEKPDIVECEVSEHSTTYPNLVFRYINDWWEISKACNFPDFIGFKYEDGRIRSTARIYTHTTGNYNYMTAEEYGTCKVLTPIAVLFRSKKCQT